VVAEVPDRAEVAAPEPGREKVDPAAGGSLESRTGVQPPAAKRVVTVEEFKIALERAMPAREPQFQAFSKPETRRIADPQLGAVLEIRYEDGTVRYLPDAAVYDAATGKTQENRMP